MAGYDTLVALVHPNAHQHQLSDAEEYRKLEVQSSALRRTHRVTFFNLALAKHVNIVFFHPGLQNIFLSNLWLKLPALDLFTPPTDQKIGLNK